jgi:hypothetical protein
MRYYDIASRIQVVNLYSALVTAGGDAAEFTFYPGGTYETGYVDRTGYTSFIQHVVLRPTIADTDGTVTLSMGLLSVSDITESTEGANWVIGAAVYTYADSTLASYRKLYITDYTVNNPEAVTKNQVTGGFTAQPYVFTPSTTTCAPVIEARIFGSLRQAGIKQYLGPCVELILGDNADTCEVSINMILGSNGEAPVMKDETASLAGTDYYYSKGQ